MSCHGCSCYEMTRHEGQLTPPQKSVPISGEKCASCAHIRRQAEDAFSELRNQTDKHILAIQRKLRDDHAGELERLKSSNENLQAEVHRLREIVGPRETATKTEIANLHRDHKERMTHQALEFEAEIAEIRKTYDQKLRQMLSEHDDVVKQVKLREARDWERTDDNQRLRGEVDRLEIELQSVKGQLGKVKLEHQVELERQLRSVATERDQAKEKLSLAEQRIASLENSKRESDIDKARADLNYRRRMGEMESEIRRTEIESVRLRREIIQLSQKIETLDNELVRSGQPALRSARNRMFALELPPVVTSNSGRIARIERSPTESRNVEALTPTSN